MKFIDLRSDKSKAPYRVAVTHFAESADGEWRTDGMVEVFDMSTNDEAERVARGCSGKGRAISLSHQGHLGHFKLHSSRLVRRRDRSNLEASSALLDA